MRAVVVTLLVLVATPLFSFYANAGAIAPELGKAISGKAPFETIPVIVRLIDKFDVTSFARNNRGVFTSNRRLYRQQLVSGLKKQSKVSQAQLSAFLRAQGISQFRNLWHVNAIAIESPVGLLPSIAARPEVEVVDLDAIITQAVTLAAVPGPPEWNIDMVHAQRLWALGYTGQGMVIANMDTGVDVAHADLQSRWRGGTNSWFDPFGQHVTPADSNGHGTGTMGILVGGDASGSSIGVAPGAQWIAAKIFNDAGTSSTSAISSSFAWMLDPDGNAATDDLPDVVNNSWTLDATAINLCVTAFEADIQALESAGIAVVFSAGNYGPGPATSVSPSNNASTFAVGSVDQSQTISYFSSRGPSPCTGSIFPEVVAPGSSVKTAAKTNGIPASYAYVSGTSFSAPHVAGAMALLKSAYPMATVAGLKDAVIQSAFDLGAISGFDNDYGYGLLNISKAFTLLPVDTDGDGILDSVDKCLLVFDPDQIDADNDGYGNMCDGDFDNNGIVNTLDLLIFRAALFTSDPLVDLDGNGFVNTLDLTLFRAMLFKAPGPSNVDL